MKEKETKITAVYIVQRSCDAIQLKRRKGKEIISLLLQVILVFMCLWRRQTKYFFYLLLATGRAISNLARNWKYCSSVCCVNPVPTNSICTTDIIINITIESQVSYINTQNTLQSQNICFQALCCLHTMLSILLDAS